MFIASLPPRLGALASLLIILLGGHSALQAQTNASWALVWSDEFNQPDGTPPNAVNWGYETGGTGWGNNELEYYTSSTNNSRIESGRLVIEARKENFGGRAYTSARLLTRGKWSWTYGRMEARIQIPRGKGIWPAFWMLGTNIDSVGWPTCGEIDIMENIGSEPGTVHGTIHGPGYSGSGGISGQVTLPGGAAFADDFHVFAVEWETNRIRWYVDGQQYFSVGPGNLPGSANWVFNAPEFMLLNVAVGGNWPGSPDASTIFPQRMTVDYVRIYAPTNGIPTNNVADCGANLLPNPGFELNGLNTWTVYGAGFNTLLGSSTNLPVHGGTNVFKVFGQFTGSENYSGIYRDTSAAPGATYRATGWALTPANDKIAVGNSAWLEISFRDAGANILSLYRSLIISNSSPAGTWLNLDVTNQFDGSTFAYIGTVSNLVAPPGTTFVRCQVVFRQPQNAAGAVLFDDLRLVTPGTGEFPVAAAAVKTANGLNLAFPSQPGAAYEVRYKDSLADSNWLVLTNLTGDGNVLIVPDVPGQGQRFYRVARICN